MKSLVLTGTLCLSFFSWNCVAQDIGFSIESQQQLQHTSLHPTLFIPLKESYQLMGFISLKTDHGLQQPQDYQHQGYGMGIRYQAAPWVNSQLLVQTQNKQAAPRLNIEVGF